VVHCEKCGTVALAEKDLPLKLPKVKNYQPTDNGESPLSGISKWVNTKCPKCSGKAKRETDTMPNWAGSSWYFLRYTDPKNNKVFADQKKLKYWMPVDWYNGGMEHTTLHLLYSRFWNKFLYDIGLVPTSEPYKKRTSHGFILASNGEKMSKSRGNVINPDDVVALHGADTFRLYEMFMGPFDQMISWGDNNIIGVRRFVERVWKLQTKLDTNKNQKLESLLHKTIKKVGDDIESMSFNTAVSSMMILANEMEYGVTKKDFEIFLTIMSPFAPHITEEIWHRLGHKTLLVTEKWPKFDESKIKEESVIIVVQINGKVRTQFEAKAGISENTAKEKAFSLPEVKKWLVGKEAKKVIFVPNKIINFVV
jgi:leucyl-tRNA synthetase